MKYTTNDLSRQYVFDFYFKNQLWYTIEQRQVEIKMYGDLRSKLEMYKNKQTAKPERSSPKGLDIHELVEGIHCENDGGNFFTIEKRYPLLHMHGGYSPGQLRNMDMKVLACVFGGLDENLTVEDMIFLDTETTGLSGGAGTVAFLVGIGFFEEDFFVMRQYFMRDYNEEPAVLLELNKQLGRFKAVVSFNGKAFDWNLLSARFALNRIRVAMKNPVHMDLLYPSRKIWKLKLESCRLTSLEESILGEYRADDVSGAAIPSIYFKYLEDRNATEVKKIIAHNELDILSMLSLLSKIYSLVENPLAESDGDKELLGIGRILEDTERFQGMLECYNACSRSNNGLVKGMAAKRLANAYKRNLDYESAVRQWESMIEDKDTLSLYPLIELAKFYEHRTKEIGKALELVDRAMALAMSSGLQNRLHFMEIRKRYDRLKRKAGKNNG